MGEVYLESDRQKMFEVIRAARKPCLVYKVLAAGRASLSPGGIREAFSKTLAAIKPTDAILIGMYQKFGDQLGENAAMVSEICAELSVV